MDTPYGRTNGGDGARHPHQASSSSGMATLLEDKPSTMRSLVTGRCELNNVSWRLGGMDWSFVLSGVHWGTVGLIVISTIAVVAMSTISPTKRAYVPGDTSLSHAHTDKSIPDVVCIMVPIILFVMMVLLGEFWLFSRVHKYLENAVIATLFFLLDWVSAILVGMVWWRMSVVVVGRPAPDFFALCQQVDSSVARGGICVEEGEDSRKAFFPLMPALAMITAIYNANYIIYLVYHRAQSCPKMRKTIKPIGQGGMLDRALEEIGHATLMYFILIQIGVAWSVSVLAIIDYRHFVADVNSAMIIGAIIGFLFSQRANSFYPRILKKQASRNSTSRHGNSKVLRSKTGDSEASLSS